MAKSRIYTGNIADVVNNRIFPGQITVEAGFIMKVEELDETFTNYIIPGFVDAHIHVESSMLIPSEFARMAVVHGTVATVSDPHEIANVLGVKGVEYMIEDAKKVPLKIYFGAPSCVPATIFETSGATIGVKDVEYLLEKKEILYLSEVMNYPGVINGDQDLLAKINAAHVRNKVVDGHAPGLKGAELRKYIERGISTDHESFEYEEGLEKLCLGMKLLIREGSAAKNFEALAPLIENHWQNIMFCSDDKHPDDFVKGHINEIVKRAFKMGFDKVKVLQCAGLNAVKHYGLNVGMLQQGDDADFVLVDDLEELSNLRTYIKGELLAENGYSFIPHQKSEIVNNFNISIKHPDDFTIEANSNIKPVIEAINGQLITNRTDLQPDVGGGNWSTSVENDILKIAVVNRYHDAPVMVGHVKGFGLKQGAIASSVAHDSHNIVAIGVDDESICKAVNAIIHAKGGLSAVSRFSEKLLPLPIAGIMSNEPYENIVEQYTTIDLLVKEMGSKLDSPFMTLSFMALLVIPKLKISDLGLFDVEKFEFVT